MNTFDLTIKHNLHVGMQNAANAIKMGCYEQALELLSGTQEMLSLIEPEGEQPEWIDVKKVPPMVNKEYWVYGVRGYDKHEATYRSTYRSSQYASNHYYWECWDLREDEELIVSHYREIPDAPVTLSEASNHSFQQAVEIPAHPKVQAFGDFLGSFDTTNNQ